ncbi:hypothetical protein LTR66_017222, partial [Elasticomyces elasticus]
MAAPAIERIPATPEQNRQVNGYRDDDVFSSTQNGLANGYQHRFASRFDLAPTNLEMTASPSQVKRAIEAHLAETDRRLEDTQKLGTSLIKQREDLTTKLEELEQHQNEETIPDDLRKRLLEIEQEHADVGKEVARALIAPKAKTEEAEDRESTVFSSHPTGSPVKASAPNRRHRNQPSTKAGDLQFAADISTSLLAQVRTLQAAVAEKEEALRKAQAERERLDHDVLMYGDKLRTLDEKEQKYKDENWDLEAQNHQLQNDLRDVHEREKRLNTNLTSMQRERLDLQTEIEELTLACGKLQEDQSATRRTHESEVHNLKRNADTTDIEHKQLQDKINQLTAQNLEFAKELTARRQQEVVAHSNDDGKSLEDEARDLDTPEDSPTGSPVKATPGKPMLDSDTLRGSLTHAHRMIQNLKSNIHREKTEKFELKRMLQETREELEASRRGDAGANKRVKTKPESAAKKTAHLSMLGNNRRPRTDIEVDEDDEDWEEQNAGMPSQHRSTSIMRTAQPFSTHQTDFSDAYQTANETDD